MIEIEIAPNDRLVASKRTSLEAASTAVKNKCLGYRPRDHWLK
jgi:hypothetical protein